MRIHGITKQVQLQVNGTEMPLFTQETQHQEEKADSAPKHQLKAMRQTQLKQVQKHHKFEIAQV